MSSATAAPFFTEVGSGAGVVCLHANASTSGQWRGLLDGLGGRFHMLAADTYGAGKSPAWPAGRSLTLRDEVALLEPVLARAGDGCALVGHSYGAAIALIAALTQPQRVRALALYEPTLFALLDAERPRPNEADGIRDAVERAAAALDADDMGGAARHFIDFWMGAGSWDRTPERAGHNIARSMVNLPSWKRALFEEPTPLAAFAELRIPVLYMTGGRSPASARGVTRLLTSVLPQLEVVEFEGLGHMGPVTDPALVNPVIAGFLGRCLA